MRGLNETDLAASIRDVRRQKQTALRLSRQFGVGENTKLLYKEEAERWENLLFLLKEYPAIMAVAITLKSVGADIKNVVVN